MHSCICRGGSLPGGGTCPGVYLTGGVPPWRVYLPGGVPAWGVYLQRVVPAQGCTWQGVYLHGGCTCQGCVPAWGVYLQRIVPARGGVPTRGVYLPRYSGIFVALFPENPLMCSLTLLYVHPLFLLCAPCLQLQNQITISAQLFSEKKTHTQTELRTTNRRQV